MPKWGINFNLEIDTTSPEVVSLIAQAHALSDVICVFPITPTIQKKIDQLNIVRAVYGTTAIEGVEVTEKDVERILEKKKIDDASLVKKKAQQEVLNAGATMEFIIKSIDEDTEIRLSEVYVCQLHELVTQKVDYPNNTPGRYRTHAVVADTYKPPGTGEEVRKYMKEFIRWLYSDRVRALDPLFRALAAHFYFISIHPFPDGNGRTARAIESFFLYQGGINSRGFYSLANFYYRERTEYVQKLNYVRFSSGGSLSPFILFGLKGLVAELKIVHEEIINESKRIAFRDYTKEVLMKNERLRDSNGERMLKFLAGLSKREEGIPMESLLKSEDVLYGLYIRLNKRTFHRDLDFLMDKKLVVIVDDRLYANLDLISKYTVKKNRS